MALQCIAWPWKHASYPGDLPGWWHPGQGVRAGTSSRSLQGCLWARRAQGAALPLCKPTICHGELCLIPCAAQRPLQEGCDSWTWAGRSGGAKSRMGEYACMRRRKEEMLAKDTEKRQELGDHKSCRVFTFVSLSDIPAHSANHLVRAVISPNTAPAPDSYDVFLLIYSFFL